METTSNNANFSNETSSNISSYEVSKYPFLAIAVFGILGNALVIVSILGQRSLLNSNYYFLVLHLAICDLSWLLIKFLDNIKRPLTEEAFLDDSIPVCLVLNTRYVFATAGIYMMLVISVFRYRAAAYPLRPAISRCRLKIICGFVYLFGLIAGYGAMLCSCFLEKNTLVAYWRFLHAYHVFFFFFLPTLFMVVIYYKICRVLVKQAKYLRSVCSTQVRRSASSVKNLRHARSRRTFIVCLATVLCYAVTHMPIVVYFIWYSAGEYDLFRKYSWLYDVGLILRVAGTHSVNPLIYGILDKRLLTFWKLCLKKNVISCSSAS